MLLSAQELKETLLALMNDDRFINMLHTQYRNRVRIMFVYDGISEYTSYLIGSFFLTTFDKP